MYHLLETLLANTTTLVMVVVFGFVLLTLGVDWLVDGASALAKWFGISNLVKTICPYMPHSCVRKCKTTCVKA